MIGKEPNDLPQSRNLTPEYDQNNKFQASDYNINSENELKITTESAAKKPSKEAKKNDVEVASYNKLYSDLIQESKNGTLPPVNPLSAPKKLQKVGRNDLCPCGSGKKFKNCCSQKL